MSGSLLLHLVTSSGFGKHSMWMLFTYISGPTQFPEFSGVLLLDGIQVGYYDSETNRVMKVGAGGERRDELDLGQVALDVMLQSKMEMSRRSGIVRKQLNLTSPGVYVIQRMGACEVQEDNQHDFITFRDGANGYDADSVQYNRTHFLYGGGDGWDFQLDTMKQMYMQMRFQNIYLLLRKRSGSEGISMETQESPRASTDEGLEPGVEDRDVTAPLKQISSK
ncbi:uncharacterized protein LOC133440512 [Cololabis saira]|uniref:uncharacterized protein LOC133440512 n=1 Tax=Cololabis saira TaxID=129043 RepID=UPI002AD2C431|nr:uncharacterized protein LOC133440512 [Cololabis saira]